MSEQKKKRILDLPTAEAIAELFPTEIVELAQRVAHEKDHPTPPLPPEHPSTPLPPPPSV